MTRSEDLGGCLEAFFALLLGRRGRYVSPATPGDLPYRPVDSLLTPAEISFYHVLREALPESLVLCPQVRLADLLFVTNTNRHYTYFNKIAQKHVDIVVCNARTLKPLAAIELDDSSHASMKRLSRDAFVERAFQSAHLPLLRFSVRRAYQPAQLRARVLACIPQPDTPTATATTPSATDGTPPRCPKCGAFLVERTAKRGAHAGQRFWGCPNYPACRYILAIPDPSPPADGETRVAPHPYE